MTSTGLLIIVVIGNLIARFIDEMISEALKTDTEKNKREYVTPQLILDRGLVAQMRLDELITDKQHLKIQDWLTEKEKSKQESEWL